MEVNCFLCTHTHTHEGKFAGVLCFATVSHSWKNERSETVSKSRTRAREHTDVFNTGFVIFCAQLPRFHLHFSLLLCFTEFAEPLHFFSVFYCIYRFSIFLSSVFFCIYRFSISSSILCLISVLTDSPSFSSVF